MHPDHHHADKAGLAAPDAAAIVRTADLASLGTAGAAPAGLSPPHKEEFPGLGGDGELRDQDKADTSIVADLDGPRKAFLTLRARFAMAGFALLELSDGSLLATRWNLCRPLPDATAALRFLRQIGGAV